jgi:hypothetical protein
MRKQLKSASRYKPITPEHTYDYCSDALQRGWRAQHMFETANMRYNAYSTARMSMLNLNQTTQEYRNNQSMQND